MFTAFFYLLRSWGVNVSINEWLTFIEALEKNLHGSSFTGFYYLCRAILVKSEADFDHFDGAFLEYFKNVVPTKEIPDELMRWLENPKEKPGEVDKMRGAKNALLSDEEILKMLEERLKEQDSEHNGGTYWVGTGGASVFGNSGYSPKGIRVGGESRYRLAFKVAGERRFRDFRNDTVLNTRQFQVAFRKLRQFSSRIDAPRTEFDIDETIDETCNNAGNLKVVYQKPRKNTVKLLLLIDSGGSMEYYSNLCTSLFQAVSKSNHFKDLKVYYFHNCVYSQLYNTPSLYYNDSVSTQWVLDNLDSEYKVIFVGDAAMAPWELTGRRFGSDATSGIEWLNRFKAKYEHIVWLNPDRSLWGISEEEREWADNYMSYMRQTYNFLRTEFDMYPLTVKDLERALKKLMVAK